MSAPATAGSSAPLVSSSVRRDLFLVTAGQTLAVTGGTVLVLAAQAYATFDIKASATVITLIFGAWAAPSMLLSALAGGRIDAFGPKAVALVAGTVSAVGAVLAGLSLGSVPVLIACLAVASLGRAFAAPALDTLPSWLASRPEQATVSAWLSYSTSLPVLAGPLLGSAALAAFGTRTTLLLAAILLAAAAASVIALHEQRPEEAQPDTGATKENIVVGRSRLWGIPALRPVIAITVVVWAGVGIFTALEAVFVRDALRAPISVLTWIMIAFGAGLIASSMALTRWPALLTHRRILWGSALGCGLGEVVYVITTDLAVVLLGNVIWGASCSLFFAASRTKMLALVPAGQHGGALGIWRAIISTANLTPTLLIGLTVDALGVQTVMLLTAALATTASPLGYGGRYRARHAGALGPGQSSFPFSAQPALVVDPRLTSACLAAIDSLSGIGRMLRVWTPSTSSVSQAAGAHVGSDVLVATGR
ncbi:MFS transporter [Nonomuraea sp. NPDC049695]|uniref:MFS transporter n=1 Tax=Nonomuraea sp. NPDC049695 TaxID=3154734 RepID=UPI00343C5A46